jgi:hypothetical protein
MSATAEIYPASHIKRHRATKADVEQRRKDLLDIVAATKLVTVRQAFYQAAKSNRNRELHVKNNGPGGRRKSASAAPQNIGLVLDRPERGQPGPYTFHQRHRVCCALVGRHRRHADVHEPVCSMETRRCRFMPTESVVRRAAGDRPSRLRAAVQDAYRAESADSLR